MKPDEVLKLKLPENVLIQEIMPIPEGETNDVYYCDAILDGKLVKFFLKINKNPKINLKNEETILQALQLYHFPIPRVLFSSQNTVSFLALEEIQGTILWDLIDPRRKQYDPDHLQFYLFEYGKWLAKIHQLPLKWSPQKRPKLYQLIGEEVENDSRFKRLILWLKANQPKKFENVFVHGDYNTANLLFNEKKIKGIIDWEFAGAGWKEYDIAWALRARQHFLNSQEEREIILQGYSSMGTYNPISLKWCEILNYLHFAYWFKESDTQYRDFALHKSEELLGSFYTRQSFNLFLDNTL